MHAENLEITNLLLTAGAKAAPSSRYKITPLALAAGAGNAAIVERLLTAGVDPNSASEEDQTALMSAALNGKPEAMRALLRRGANVNAVEAFKGQTALMFAAGEGNTSAVELLLEFGADLKAKSKGGYTALLFAVRNNRLDTVKFLLQYGANVNDAISDGTAALNMSLLNADFDLASLLLDFGANPNVRDPRGFPLHIVVWLHEPGALPDFAMSGVDPQPPPKPSGRVTHLEIAKKLLDTGADPNGQVMMAEGRFAPGGGLARTLPEASWQTAGPFSGVSEAERLDAVKLALELGNDINARTNFGEYKMLGSPERTLLTYPDNIKDLLDLGVGGMRFNGMTALRGSIICNQPTIVQFLIDKGAKLDETNQLGWTPLMVLTGLYIANNRKDFPREGELLKKALTARGLPVK